jgi:hypothetical protein
MQKLFAHRLFYHNIPFLLCKACNVSDIPKMRAQTGPRHLQVLTLWNLFLCFGNVINYSNFPRLRRSPNSMIFIRESIHGWIFFILNASMKVPIPINNVLFENFPPLLLLPPLAFLAVCLPLCSCVMAWSQWTESFLLLLLLLRQGHKRR